MQSHPTSRASRLRRSLRRAWRVRIRPMWQMVEWLVIAALAATALALGTIGFSRYAQLHHQPYAWLQSLYRSLQLFVLESGGVDAPLPWQLQIARFLAPAVAAYTAIQAFLAVFNERLESTWLRTKRCHTVICGLGRKGNRLAMDLAAVGEQVVVIEKNEANPFIDGCRNMGISVLTGDATHKPELVAARAHRAKRLVSVCGDDAVNADIAVQASDLVATLAPGSSRAFESTAHITDPLLWHQIGGQDILMQRLYRSRLQFFSVYDSGARQMIRSDPYFGDDVDDVPDARPHVVIIGVGVLGMSLAGEVARRWWVRNGVIGPDGHSRSMSPGNRFRMTLIDLRAEEKLALLSSRYPQLIKACALGAIQIDVRSAAFGQLPFLAKRPQPCDVTSIYICFDGDELALATALFLRNRLSEECPDIFVRMSREVGLATVLESDGEDGSELHAFPLLKHTCTAEIAASGMIEIVARRFHGHYVDSCMADGQTVQDNASLVPWDELPERLRGSSRQQAMDVPRKLREANCRLVRLQDWDADLFAFPDDVVQRLAEMEHRRWLVERSEAGWQHSDDKDTEKRRHPYLLPLEDMTPGQREQVLKFNRASIRSLPKVLADIGLQIVPR